MERCEIYVRMFQTMELEYDGCTIKETEHHSPKLWMLLAYVLYYRQKGALQNALLSAVWPEKKAEAGVLKTAMHRLRGLLATQYGEEFGRTFLYCHNRLCSLGESYEPICDFEEFERYVIWAKQTQNEEERFLLYKAVTDLYRGDFLESFSDVAWVTPIQIYYHNLYLDAVYSVAEYYEKNRNYAEAVGVLQKAERLEKYEEKLYIGLMRNLLYLNKYEEVVQIYEHVSVMLKETFGLLPSEEATELYRDAVREQNTGLMELEEIVSLTEKQEEKKKALYCDFSVFKEMYYVYSCNAERSNQAVCFVVLNITDLQDRILQKRSLDCCVKNLKTVLCENLRSGDIVSMCTPSQFVLLLPNAGEREAYLATERVQKLFFKKYIHSPAKFSVQVRKITKYHRYEEIQDGK